MHWLPRGGAGKILIKRKSLKAWVAKKGEEGGGARKILTKRYKKNVVFKSESLKALVAKWGGADEFLIANSFRTEIVSESGVVSESEFRNREYFLNRSF